MQFAVMTWVSDNVAVGSIFGVVDKDNPGQPAYRRSASRADHAPSGSDERCGTCKTICSVRPCDRLIGFHISDLFRETEVLQSPAVTASIPRIEEDTPSPLCLSRAHFQSEQIRRRFASDPGPCSTQGLFLSLLPWWCRKLQIHAS